MIIIIPSLDTLYMLYEFGHQNIYIESKYRCCVGNYGNFNSHGKKSKTPILYPKFF